MWSMSARGSQIRGIYAKLRTDQGELTRATSFRYLVLSLFNLWLFKVSDEYQAFGCMRSSICSLDGLFPPLGERAVACFEDC